MTLATGQGYTSQVCAGDLAPIAVSFPVYANADGSIDLAVELRSLANGALLETAVYPTHYTFTRAAAPSVGGTITPLSATVFASGRRAWVIRNTKAHQETRFAELVKFPGQASEMAVDRTTAEVQDVARELSRTAKLARGLSAGDIPAPVEGGVLGWVSGAWDWVSNLADTLVSSFMASALMATTAHAFAKHVSGLLTVATRADLKALTSPQAGVTYRTMAHTIAGYGGGVFDWNSSNLAPKCATDRLEGVYVKLTGTDGSTGAFVRRFEDYLHADWFGAAGRNVTGDATANLAAFEAAMQLRDPSGFPYPVAMCGTYPIDGVLDTFGYGSMLFGKTSADGDSFSGGPAVIRLLHATATGIEVDNVWCVLKDFVIKHEGTRTAGAHVLVDHGNCLLSNIKARGYFRAFEYTVNSTGCRTYDCIASVPKSNAAFTCMYWVTGSPLLLQFRACYAIGEPSIQPESAFYFGGCGDAKMDACHSLWAQRHRYFAPGRFGAVEDVVSIYETGGFMDVGDYAVFCEPGAGAFMGRSSIEAQMSGMTQSTVYLAGAGGIDGLDLSRSCLLNAGLRHLDVQNVNAKNIWALGVKMAGAVGAAVNIVNAFAGSVFVRDSVIGPYAARGGFYGANASIATLGAAITGLVDISNNKVDGNTATTITNYSGNTANVKVRNNAGFVTEAIIQVVILNGTTSITFSHSLNYTPDKRDFVAMPGESWGAATKYWVDTFTSTQATLRVDIDPGTDVDFTIRAGFRP